MDLSQPQPGDPKVSSPLPVFRKLWRQSGTERRPIAVAMGATLANQYFDLLAPILVGWAVDTAIGKPPSWLRMLRLEQRWQELGAIGVAALVIFAGESYFQWLYQSYFQRSAQRIQHRVRGALYEKLQTFGLSFFEQNRVGHLLSIVGDDINQMEVFLNTGMGELLRTVVLVVMAFGMLLQKSPPLTALAILPIPFIIWSSLRFQKRVTPAYAGVRSVLSDLTSRLENSLSGMATIKAFGKEGAEAERVAAASAAYADAHEPAIRYGASLIPVLRMWIALGFALVLVGGGYLVSQGRMSAGQLAAFALLTERLLWPLTKSGQVLYDMARVQASLERVFGLLETQLPAQHQVADPPSGALEFRQLSFAYPEQALLFEGLDVTIRPGEIWAVVGATGSGKSTLAKLLLGLYEPEKGGVYWGAEANGLHRLATGRWRDGLAWVPQEPFLFDGSLGENVAYGFQAASDEQLCSALRLAAAEEFVRGLPEGLSTRVGERGVRLSGGQRQRIAVARALLLDPEVLVLDEATSALDAKTEEEMLAGLLAARQGKTTVMIAHRLSTVRRAHQIMVLDGGKVAEVGSHRGLLQQGGIYADLWARHQLVDGDGQSE